MARDMRDGTQRDRSNRIARHASVGGQLALAHGRPRRAVRPNAHEARHGVGGRHAVRFALLGRHGDRQNVRHIRRELSKERNNRNASKLL